MRLSCLQLILLVLVFATTTLRVQAAEQPNIIFIITDDLNTQVLRDGSPVRVATPNLDRLRQRGVSFYNAHAVSPICGPSRAGMLCGYYPQTSGYWGWNQQKFHWRKNELLSKAPTIFEHARDNGYLIAGGGKIFHNGHHDKTVFMDGDKKTYGPMDSHGPWPLKAPGPAWREWTSHPDFAGMGHFGFYTPLSNVPQVSANTEKGTAGYHGWGDHRGAFHYKDNTDRDPMPDEKLAQWAAQWINTVNDERPFLLCVGFNRPHSPWVVPDKYFTEVPLESVKAIEAPADDITDNAAELMPPSPDTWTRAGIGKYKKIMTRDGHMREWSRAYMACVRFVDAQLGIVLDAVDASSHAQNTIIIFTSDHGYHMGEKQRVFKNTLWEPSTSVPLVMSGPGIAMGQQCEEPVSLIDMYPTIVEMAQLPAQRQARVEGFTLPALDGVSLLPQARDPAASIQRPAVLSNVPARTEPNADKNLAIPEQHWSVRSKRYRYVRANAGGEELYDMQADPHEWKNLATDPQYAAIKSTLQRQMIELVGSALLE